MEEKQRVSSENYNWLRKQIIIWQEKNVLTQDQGDKIRELYEPESKTSKSDRTITIISVLGAVLLGLGVILFFASNWRYIPYQVKLVLIVGFICTTYFTGYYIAYEKKNYPKVGNTLIMLGTLFFGAAIWLIAQMFNIHYDSYAYQLIWAIGALGVALVIGKDLNYSLSLILFSIYFVLFQRYHYESVNFIMPLVIALHLYLGIKNRLKGTVSFSILAGLMWVEAIMIACLVGDNNELGLTLFVIPIFYSVFVYCGARIYEKYNNINENTIAIRIIGLLGILFVGFLLTFSGIIDSVMYYSSGNLHINKTIIFFTIVGVITLLTIIYNMAINRETKWQVEGLFLFLLCIVPVTYFISLAFINGNNNVYYNYNSELVDLALIIFNVVYAASIINFIQIGVYERNEKYINLSLLFMALFIIARYFDLGWSLLGKSGFFMIGGIILIFVAIFIERLRRKMLKEMRVTDYEE